MNCRLASFAAAAILSAAAPSRAQSIDQPERVAWTEIGVGAGIVGFTGEGGMAFPSATMRVNVSRRDAIDFTGVFNVGPYSRGLSGFYLFQGRHTFAPSSPRVAPYAAYGVIGSFTYRRQPEFRYTLSTGDTVVVPASTYRRLTKPFGVLGGGGARIRVARYAFVDGGAELCLAEGGYALIASAGVMIPIGRGR